MNRLIISAPFGNYIDWPDTTPTLGTYTREYRAGVLLRLWRIVSTVRYYPGIQAWKNKLGLPNPGIDSIINRQPLMDRAILSISARNTLDWLYLIKKARELNPLAIELNVSCPNTGEVDQSEYDFIFRNVKEAIVKLPPIGYEAIATQAYDNGITRFHCCNTLPIAGGLGGLSGKPLKMLSLRCVKWVSAWNKVEIIGGGGITGIDDIKAYSDAGATHFAIASVLFNPLKWRELKKIATIINQKGPQ